MNRKFLVAVVFALMLCPFTKVFAQSVAINSTSALPNNSSILDVSSTDKGMLIPRMDSAHRVAIVLPALGLLVYQTNGQVPGFYYYNGLVWINLANGAGWVRTANNQIYNPNTTGNVGIGTTSPTGRLHVIDSAVVFTGTTSVPTGSTALTPVSGAGTRMLWYPQKAAFRAGYATGNYWDRDSIGLFSAAFGKNTVASGRFSFAAGDSSYAMGTCSVALGGGNQVWGPNTVNGDYTFGAGFANIVQGNYSAALGAYNVSQGVGAYSFGMNAVASIDSSMAIGYNCYALHKGACMITDENGNWSGAVIYSSLKNQMTMRFTGGYRLYTNWTGTSSTIGVSLPAGANSWAVLSDRTRKTNFEPVNGEEVLRKLNGFEMTTWNYKEQEPENFRHYGPMAQDFFAAFGHDKFGTIGNDSTIAQSDLEGVSLVAIQALIRRTDALAGEIKTLKPASTTMPGESNNNPAITELQKQNEELKQQMEALRQEMAALKKLIKTKS